LSESVRLIVSASVLVPHRGRLAKSPVTSVDN
jgi:hypothetical protein